MLSLDCPHCRKRIELDESRRGRPSRCPRCQGMFRAPLFDGEAGIAASAAGRGDTVLLAAAGFAGLGLVLTGAALLTYFAGGGRLLVPWNALLVTLPLPLIPIGITWYAVRRTQRQGLVWVARILAYLWLAGQVYLTFRSVMNR